MAPCWFKFSLAKIFDARISDLNLDWCCKLEIMREFDSVFPEFQ